MDLQEEASSLCLLLMLKQNIEATIPPKLKILLKDYHDVVLEKIPPRLLPMCDIQYAIDFILPFVIPNKLAYQMSP